MSKKIVCGVTVDSKDFYEINTYGDYVRSLSNEELANWIYTNIIRRKWKGTNELVDDFRKSYDGTTTEVKEISYCRINNIVCCDCQPVCGCRYYKESAM